MHSGPDSFAGGGDVADLPSGRVDASVDATEERDEGGSSRLEVGRITEPERSQSRTEHHPVQVGFAQSTYVGPQAVLEGVFMRLGEIGDDFAVVPEQFVADGETVVALGSYGWKHKSSGEPAVVKMVHVWTMSGGKAVAFQQHVDTLKVRELS